MLGKEKKELKDDEITDCQKNPAGNTEKYDAPKGCYTKLKDSVRDHKSKILGVAITILVVMVSFILRSIKKFGTYNLLSFYDIITSLTIFIYFQFMNMLFAFALCTMAKK